jgi:hypothetical protein
MYFLFNVFESKPVTTQETLSDKCSGLAVRESVRELMLPAPLAEGMEVPRFRDWRDSATRKC